MKITIKNLDNAKYQTKPGKWTHVVVKGIATRTCQSKDGARTWLNVIFDTNIGNISGYETTLKKNFINYEDMEVGTKLWLKVVEKGKWMNFTEASYGSLGKQIDLHMAEEEEHQLPKAPEEVAEECDMVDELLEEVNN